MLLFLIGCISIRLEYKSYYYGIGKDYFSTLIPREYYLDYGTYSSHNPSTSIMQKDMNLFLVTNNNEITLEDKSTINVKSFLGYYFNDKELVAKISDNSSKIKFISISDGGNRFNEIFLNNTKNYSYVNLDYPKSYFQSIILFRYLTLFVLIVLSLYLMVYLFIRLMFLLFNIDNILKW